MAQETKVSVPVEGTLRDILSVLERKIRNLEKRKGRLEIVEKELEMGKEISRNQRLALEKKDQVLETLDMVREFLVTAEQFSANDDLLAEQRAKKAQRDQSAKIMETVGQVLRLQSLLELGQRKEEIDDNEVLDSLEAAYEETKKKNNFKLAARFWLNVLEAKPKEMIHGITFEAAHHKLSMIGDFLDKTNDPLLLVNKETSVRGETPSSTEGSEAVDNQTTNEQQKPEEDIVTVEDSIINNQIEAERLAQASRTNQPVATCEVPSMPANHYVLPGVAVIPVSPVQHEEVIQFGSVDHVVQPVLHPITPIPPQVTNPPMRFESGEFDFLQDDLTVPLHSNTVHMDPAVVAVSGATAPYDAHYQQMLQMHHQQLVNQHQEMMHQTGMAAEIPTETKTTTTTEIEEEPKNSQMKEESSNNNVKERRSPNEHHRNNHHGERNHFRNSNGMNGYSNGRGSWSNRNGNGPNWNRGERTDNRNNSNYNNGTYNGGNSGRQQYNGGYGNRNSMPRREQTAQRV